MAFTVATLNVLADAYLQPAWYPYTPAELLRPGLRTAPLCRYLTGLGAEVLCLQEVEHAVFAAIEAELEPLGYSGRLTLKDCGRPDGCATFARTSRFESVRTLRIVYQDRAPGAPRSGHVAQIQVLRNGTRLLGVANTHLKWDTPDAPRDRRYGPRQITQLLRERDVLAPECAGWIVAGDFNAELESDVVALLLDAGFKCTHGGSDRSATCNSNRRPKQIDFLFHDRALRSTPMALPAISPETPLPGPDFPSDHVAVVASFDWADLPAP